MSFMDKFRGRRPDHRQAAVPVALPTVKPFSMERTGVDTAEIVLYGDIVSERPTDWWGDPIEGQYIILSEFLEELKQVEDVDHLTVRIHSAGGNAYDAMVIHNRLQALATDVTVIVDGVAMSGGSLIMCAGNSVQVYPGSLIMIHKCWSFLFGGYNASELRRMADSNDAVDRSQAAIYQAKTGLPADELLSMMEAETYMTGQEALDKGFADELLEGTGVEIAASADRRTLFVGAMPVWVSSRKDGIPAIPNIPTIKSAALSAGEIHKNQPVMTGNQKGGNKPMANSIEELRQEYPELTAQLEAEVRASAGTHNTDTISEAVQAEQRRIQEIDEISALFDEELVQAAKYGKDACTAQELTYRAAQRATQQGHAFLTNMENDAKTSGAQSVPAVYDSKPVSNFGEQTPAQRMAEARAEVQELFGKKKKEG